ncbi:MAG: SDR family oxidoreductase, partial [Planctomycetota bacterium]
VRQDPDGSFVYCGRIDRQINFNGLRIEPEEIESAILTLQGVFGAAVLMRKISSASQSKRLVAFVEAEEGLTNESIRKQLAEILPSSRMPQRIEICRELPRTSSGKTDFSALAVHPFVDEPQVDSVNGRQEVILNLFSEATGEAPLGITARWRDWGADSLAAIQIVALAEQRGLQIPLWFISGNPSPQDVLRFLEEKDQSNTEQLTFACSTDRLREEAKQVFSKLPLQHKRDNAVAFSDQVILLTGATGFLGSRVLSGLLERTSSKIICLVRPGSTAADERLRSRLADQQVELPQDCDRRIEVLLGDISSSKFGLTENSWRRLVESTKTVVHCAADISALAPFEDLRNSNLIGTANVLALARMANANMHHASTLSVFVGTDAHAGVFDEHSELAAKTAFGGYAQAKLAAEFLLKLERDVPITLHRLGLLAADQRTGIYPENDILTMMVQGLLQVGCVPNSERDLRFDLTPVDYAAAAMAAMICADQGDILGESTVRHIAGRATCSLVQLRRYLQKHAGIGESPPTIFWDRLARAEATCAISSLEATALKMSFGRWLGSQGDSSRALDLFQSTETKFDCRRTGELAESLGVEWPLTNEELLDNVLGRLCRDSLAKLQND